MSFYLLLHIAVVILHIYVEELFASSICTSTSNYTIKQKEKIITERKQCNFLT